MSEAKSETVHVLSAEVGQYSYKAIWIVGVFDDEARANQAMEELVSAADAFQELDYDEKMDITEVLNDGDRWRGLASEMLQRMGCDTPSFEVMEMPKGAFAWVRA